MAQTIYKGVRVGVGMKPDYRGKCLVDVNDLPLHPALDVEDYKGKPLYEWGCRGTATNNLAMSILTDHFQRDDIPLELCQEFVKDFLLKCDFEMWELTESQLNTWLDIKAKQFDKKEE